MPSCVSLVFCSRLLASSFVSALSNFAMHASPASRSAIFFPWSPSFYFCIRSVRGCDLARFRARSLPSFSASSLSLCLAFFALAERLFAVWNLPPPPGAPGAPVVRCLVASSALRPGTLAPGVAWYSCFFFLFLCCFALACAGVLACWRAGGRGWASGGRSEEAEAAAERLAHLGGRAVRLTHTTHI